MRLLRRSPSFTAAAIISLALGMGASGAMLGLLNAVRLRNLPVANAGDLAEIRLDGPRCCRHTGRNRQVSLPLWQEIARQQQAFSSVFAFADTRSIWRHRARSATWRVCRSRATSSRRSASRRCAVGC